MKRRSFIPKTVVICGQVWKVTLNKKNRGAWYSGDDQHIEIGTKSTSDDTIKENFLHEVWEAILSERMLRYHQASQLKMVITYLFLSTWT